MEGDFTFIRNPGLKTQMEDLFNAIYVADAWDFVGDGTGCNSFSESTAPELFEIVSYMEHRVYDAHQFDFMMKNMQKIAIHGWETFVKNWIN